MNAISQELIEIPEIQSVRVFKSIYWFNFPVVGRKSFRIYDQNFQSMQPAFRLLSKSFPIDSFPIQ